MTNQNITEALRDLVEASRIIVINEVPSDEAWRDFNDAYDAAVSALATEPSEPTGFDLRSNDVRPPRSVPESHAEQSIRNEYYDLGFEDGMAACGSGHSDAATAPDEPHRDYAGRTCATGLMHAHAAPDEPSRGGIRVLPPSRLADAEALLEQALYLPSMYTDDARAVIEAISTFLSEREVRAASAPASPDEPSIPTTTAGLELYERLDRNEIRKGGMPQRWRDLIVAIEREARAAHLNPADSGSSASGSTDSQSPGVQRQ